MKKIKLFVMVMILGIITTVASSAKQVECQKDQDCPAGMTCIKVEGGYRSLCIEGSMILYGIKCFSCIHKDADHAIVECSTCTLKEGWTDDFFCTSDRCMR